MPSFKDNLRQLTTETRMLLYLLESALEDEGLEKLPQTITSKLLTLGELHFDAVKGSTH